MTKLLCRAQVSLILWEATVSGEEVTGMAAIIAQISLAARERKVDILIYFWLKKNIVIIDFVTLQRRALEEPPVDINRSVYKLPPSGFFLSKSMLAKQ